MKVKEDLINQIEQEARAILDDSLSSHDWDHILRVYKLCEHIGQIEGADMEILRLAAILHDIGRMEQHKSKGKICHAQKGAEMAGKILVDHGLSQEKIDKIVHCIRTHRSKGKNTPETLEAKILFDADKLDSLGAIGLARTYAFTGEIGSRIHNKDVDVKSVKEYSREDNCYWEFLANLQFKKDKMMTKEGKRMALERHKFMADFFERINKEVDGEM
jgi:uncharacterized protein